MKRISIVISLAISILIAACQQGPAATPTATPSDRGPSVVIVTPASNSTFNRDEQVQIQSTSIDPEGIVLVELLVDGQSIQNSPTPNGQPQQHFSVIQTWTASTPGTHTVSVRATNTDLAVEEASITVNVAQEIAQTTGTPTLVINPTAPPVISTTTPIAGTSTPNPVPTSSGPSTCTLSSTFISDVTIPDGTVIAPGGSFIKTWAIQNSGTCSWGGGYNAVFVAGNSMGARSPQPVPSAGPGDTVNISINMVAPTAPGRADSVWQIQASNGVLFGTRFDAVIVVPGAPPPKPPTPVPPPPPPPSGCNGTPVFNGFSASPSTINPNQVSTLSWGPVQNANAVYLTSPSGTTGVATPGSQQVQISQTTSYTLTAYCGNNPAQLQVTVNVQGGGGGCNGTPIFNGFYANPQTINSGQQTTLSWGLVRNANAVFLQLPNRSEGVATPGSRVVQPGQSVTYTLTAYCGNNQASIKTTVNVNGGCSGNPRFNGFSANPPNINRGQSSVLSWGPVDNASAVQLQTPQGTSGVGTPGNLTVKPGSTTTYTLIAYCGNNRQQVSVTVNVNAPPPTPPPPTRPPQPNSVSNITARQLNARQFRLQITYYWNGQDAPARIVAVGLNANGKVITQGNPPQASANQQNDAGTTLEFNSDRTNLKQFQACLVGRSGSDLACRSIPWQ